MTAPHPPRILVLAGVNGAGKSSLGGEIIRRSGLNYFNPDEAARRIQATTRCSIAEANGLAWEEGKRRLEAAINGRLNHAFESTLAGRTMPALLIDASRAEIEVLVWFVGLSSPEQHIARVRARVAAGGHDIPEEMIRKRWHASRRNVVDLMPHLAELQLFDNSAESEGQTIPEPRLLLRCDHRRIVAPAFDELQNTPEWAKPIIAAALKLQRPLLPF
jgi:predicted ABC-type ATPase